MSDRTETFSGHTIRRPDRPASVRAGAWLATSLADERDRWPLWAPVGFGIGVAIYFSLSAEPDPLVGFAALGTAIVTYVGTRRAYGIVAVIALMLAVVAAGFVVAQTRAGWVEAPILVKEHGPIWLAGAVLAVDPRPNGQRVTFDVQEADGLAPDRTPRRVRISVRTDGVDPVPGQALRVRAVLMPPPEPVAPDAYDFGRALYFQRIGAVGYAVSPLESLATGQSDAPPNFVERISVLRLAVSERIDSAMAAAGSSAESPPVAVALLTGLRGRIAEDVLVALRDAGLAHLLAISGLHLGLIAGITFFAVRLLLAMSERLALDYPIKKWAALVALIFALSYLALTGATVPTQRAFIMVAIVLLAVLIDREAISMRPVAWAAMVVLLWRPESLLSASFQMSFAAVTGLVAFYEWVRMRSAARSRPVAFWRRPIVYLGAVVATTVIANLATGPFAAYHFDRVALAGTVANLAAVPLTAFWIMPLGLLSLILMPLGLEALALAPMGWGIDSVIAVARFCAGLPSAVVLVPAWPVSALAAIVMGGLWLCLWRGTWRVAGLAPILAGLVTASLAQGPDVLVDGEGRLFGVRAPNGDLALSTSRAKKFDAEIWLRRNGQHTAWPWADADPGAWPNAELRCDTLGCVYRKGRGVAAVGLIVQPDAVGEDCAVSDVIISTVPVRRACRGPRLVIDRFDLWRNGAHAVWLGADGRARSRSVRAQRGDRPWVIDRLRDRD